MILENNFEEFVGFLLMKTTEFEFLLNGPFVIIFLKEGFEENIKEKENKEACNICFEVRISKKSMSYF